MIKPLTPSRIEVVAHVLKPSASGSSCWDIFPRLTGSAQRERGLDGPGAKRRAALGSLAKRRRAPGLIAYRGRDAIGWVFLGPRLHDHRVARSKATPPVDEQPVWVIPCITIRKEARGQGVATALIQAAVAYAPERGAPAVEAYPRADHNRVHDEWALHSTEPLFKKAGFKKVRGGLPVPKGWTPRVTKRAAGTMPRT